MMYGHPGRSSRWAWAGVITVALLTSAHIFLAGPHAMHSDAALKSVLGAIALEQHALIPSGWVFANGDLLTATPYPLLLPLQYVLGLGLTSNLVSVWIGFLAMLAAVWLLASRVQTAAGAQTSAVPLALMLVGSTLGAAALEFTVSQGAYSVYLALAALLLASTLFAKPTGFPLLAFLTAFALTSANPVRAAVMVVGPVLLASVCHELLPFRPGWASRLKASLLSRPMVSMLAGAGAGALMYEFVLMPDVINFDAAARITAPTFDSIVRTAMRLPADAFVYFSIGGWGELSIWERIVQYLVWTTVIMALVAPGWVLLRRSSPPGLRLLGWAAYGTLASGLLPLVFTQGLYQGAMEWRYGTIGVTLCFVVLAAVASGQTGQEHAGRALVFRVSVIAAVVSAILWTRISEPGNPDIRGISNQERLTLIRELAQQKVGTIGASYWNSHVISVLSNGRVMSNPIAYEAGVTPFVHHAPLQPLHGTAGTRHAVVLTDAQFESDDGEAMRWQFGEPVQELRSGPFRAWIYEHAVIDEAYGVGLRLDGPVPLDGIEITLAEPTEPVCGSESCVVSIEVKNSGSVPLMTAGTHPLRLGMLELDPSGTTRHADYPRVDFPTPLQPGETQVLRRRFPAKAEDGFALKPCLLQENVTWLCERTRVDGSLLMVDDAVAAEDVAIHVAVGPTECQSKQGCRVEIGVSNMGRRTLSSRGALPLRIGVQQVAEDGRVVLRDAGRVDFTDALSTDERAILRANLPPLQEQATRFRFCLLQEGVAWLCDRTTVEY